MCRVYICIAYTHTHCNILQRTMDGIRSFSILLTQFIAYHNTLQHTATHHRRHQKLCYPSKTIHSILQHAATRCNTLQHTATYHNALQQNVSHCNTLEHTTDGIGSFAIFLIILQRADVDGLCVFEILRFEKTIALRVYQKIIYI